MRFIGCALCFLLAIAFAGCRTPEVTLQPPFYPIGIYGAKTPTDLATVKAAGFNLVAGPGDRAFLDAAQSAGLKVLATPATTAGPAFDPQASRSAVKNLDRHPALWGWYVCDEPDLCAIPPTEVAEACHLLKTSGASKPTALVLSRGYEALHYAHLADITMVDRYPIPWLPLANFGQHITQARLALGPNKPLIAVIQAFDWTSCPENLPGETNFRPPTGAEIRCMTYEALARGANGLFYYAYDAGRWKILESPETWEALQSVLQEVGKRLPLFQAKPEWWARKHTFSDPAHRFNAALESSITSTLLRVCQGNETVPAGDYILAVNNTDRVQEYSFELPEESQSRKQKAESRNSFQLSTFHLSALPDVPVLDENRSLQSQNGRIADSFQPYAVHVYGRLPNR